MATAGLAEPNSRSMQSLRTRSSETRGIGSARRPVFFRRRSMDLEVVFAFAETQNGFGQDRPD